MGVGFCGEHFLQSYTPDDYCFASVYYSCGDCLEGNKPPYKEIKCGPNYSSGDVIGCGLDWNSETYFFTLNGQKHSKFHLFPGMEQTLNCKIRDHTKWRAPSEKVISTCHILGKARCPDSGKLPGAFRVHALSGGARFRCLKQLKRLAWLKERSICIYANKRFSFVLSIS
jgi:hypothetical protein